MSDTLGTPDHKIRVVIADDHPLVRSGLQSILSLFDDI
jgi:DNA-binding NarL/FixJ family response regulator